MWVTIVETYIFYVFLGATHLWVVECHLPSYITTPSNKAEQFCILSESCIHDTIPVCGKMGERKRTFLDHCDMMEFACDSNQVYSHIDDEEGCPTEAPWT